MKKGNNKKTTRSASMPVDIRKYKKYTKEAQLGNIGEAFFESLVSDYCLPHRIVAPKDLGVDFICEWVYGEKPTGILFAVQVKTISAKAQKTGVHSLNGLQMFRISNTKSIDEKTINYWKGLGIPVYLFVIVRANGSFDCFYKRFTPVLTAGKRQEDQRFFKVNNGSKFLAFKNFNEKTQGFARDLYIDHMRWNYYKGSLAYLNSRTMGLRQFPNQEQVIFTDLFRDYRSKICSTYRKVKWYLEQICR